MNPLRTNAEHKLHFPGQGPGLLEQKVGIPVLFVGEIERGESNVTLQTLKLIADTLKVKIEDLVRGI